MAIGATYCGAAYASRAIRAIPAASRVFRFSPVRYTQATPDLQESADMLVKVVEQFFKQKPAPQPSPDRRLHIGGVEQRAGWEILNAIPGPGVDHVGMADDLSRFEGGSFRAIYASHVLEHLDFMGEIQRALKEWYRVLGDGGELYVSVPDMDTLCRLFLAPELTLDDRFMVVRMVFGGHIDRHDYHQVGINFEILHAFLHEAGFVDIRRVDDLGVFDDTSRLVFKATPISLNAIARKPGRVPAAVPPR
jgi:predicted SAM-dependent methyltransferase